jgi:hydrogenase maturation factor HypF (carbamoyltransferase family)
VREAGRLLSEGQILAVKGYGGFHIATSAVKEKLLLAFEERSIEGLSRSP